MTRSRTRRTVRASFMAGTRIESSGEVVVTVHEAPDLDTVSKEVAEGRSGRRGGHHERDEYRAVLAS